MKELYLTVKQYGSLICAFDNAHPKLDFTVYTDDLIEWIELSYRCKMFEVGNTTGLRFQEDKDLTFFLLKYPC